MFGARSKASVVQSAKGKAQGYTDFFKGGATTDGQGNGKGRAPVNSSAFTKLPPRGSLAVKPTGTGRDRGIELTIQDKAQALQRRLGRKSKPSKAAAAAANRFNKAKTAKMAAKKK